MRSARCGTTCGTSASRSRTQYRRRRFGAALLDQVGPKTCKAFWDVLPYTGSMIHCAWFGHAAFYLDRVPLLDVLGYDLENRFQRLAQVISSGTRTSKR